MGVMGVGGVQVIGLVTSNRGKLNGLFPKEMDVGGKNTGGQPCCLGLS